MKTKILFVAIVVSMAVVFGFTACMDGKNSGFNYVYASPAVVENGALAGVFLHTAYGTFVPDNASALVLSTVISGSCIAMVFDYNSEYQTGEYPVASNISFLPITVNNIREEDPAMVDDYAYPFSSVNLFSTSASLNFEGRLFVETTAKLNQNQALQYYPYVKSDEPLDADGARNIYLQAKLPGTSSGTQDVATVYGLDMRDMLYSSGRDTTIIDNGEDYLLRYLKINLKYCSEIKDESPVFKSVNTQPIYILVLKKDL